MRNGPSTCKKEECATCGLDQKIRCRYGAWDSVIFLAMIAPVLVVAIAGAIKAGMGAWLWAWLAYSIVFFMLVEPIILCRYCPYWDMPGSILRCHANYGIVKLVKSKQGDSTTFEKVLFIILGLSLFLFPLVLTLIGGEYLLFSIGIVCMVQAIFILKVFICTKCVNFACILNSVPEDEKSKYFEKNETLRDAFKK